MVPVIGLLILIIAVVLFQVYRSFEGFQTAVPTYSPNKLSETTTVREYLKELQDQMAVMNYYKDLIPMVEALPQTATLTQKEHEVLYPGQPFTMKDGAGSTLAGWLGIMRGANVQPSPEMLQEQIRNIQSRLTEFNLPDSTPWFTFRERTGETLTPEQKTSFIRIENMGKQMLDMRVRLAKAVVEGRFPSYKRAATGSAAGSTTGTATGSAAGSTTGTATGSAAGSTTGTATGSAAGSTTGTATGSAAGSTTPSGNTVDISEIFTALQGYKPSVAATAAAAPTVSESTIKAIEDRLTTSIGKLIKDEMLAQRSATEKHDTTCTGSTSAATSQGCEYQQTLPPAPAPDMSQYIRKDSIPCWGCTLPS